MYPECVSVRHFLISFGANGVFNSTNATTRAYYCTFMSNIDGQEVRRGVLNRGSLHSEGCLFAGSRTNDFSGVLMSEGYNLIQNTNGCTITNDETGNIYNQDPKLGPLADYGGPTPTIPLLAGSPGASIARQSRSSIATDFIPCAEAS